MRPVKRHHVSKRVSSRRFRQNVRRTKAPNAAAMPMRGGFRL